MVSTSFRSSVTISMYLPNQTLPIFSISWVMAMITTHGGPGHSPSTVTEHGPLSHSRLGPTRERSQRSTTRARI